MFVSKFSTYYFHMKTKIIPDFQICISVPLNKSFIWISNFVHLIFWKKNLMRGLCYFTIHDPKIYYLTIHDPTMHDSSLSYLSKLKLCRENYATRKLNFTQRKTELLVHANKHFYEISC